MSDLYETTLTTSLDTAMTMYRDRNAGHVMAMRLWGDVDTTMTRGARATVGCQWAIVDLDASRGEGRVLVRSEAAPERTVAWATTQETRPATVPAAGDIVHVRTTCTAMYTPRSDVPAEWRAQLKQGATSEPRPPGQGLSYRNRQVPVPTDRLQDWAARLWQRNGLTGHVDATPAGVVTVRKETVHVAVLTAAGVEGGPSLDAVLRSGLGKKRSFGVGMVLVGA